MATVCEYDGKHTFPTKEAARAEARRLYRTYRSTRVHAYYCRKAGGWHVGHRPQPRRRRR